MLAGARLVAVANQTPADVASEFAVTQFIVRQLLNGMATAALVRVQACTNSGGAVPVGTVDVVVLVDMVTEDGQTIPHGTIFKAPYMRMQGGANALILDPEPGDIGVCVFAMRDSSAVKGDPEAARNRSPSPGAPPGSRRTYSLSDALYLGGMLNGLPTQTVRFSEAGIEIKSPTAIILEAPAIQLKGPVEQTGGDVTMAAALAVAGNLGVGGNLAVTGSTVGAGVDLNTHVHSGVESGGDNSGPPV